jgi:5'-nucleotidase
MKKYDWVLFDLDETLIRFDAQGALCALFKRFDIVFTEQHYLEYEKKNRLLWSAYQNGEITIDKLQHERFAALGDQLNVRPLDLNAAFLAEVTHISTPVDGAESLLNTLKGKSKLGVISNGFGNMQRVRIEKLGFQDHFHFVITSEQVGVAKPDPKIFLHAFETMKHPPRDKILMVGDALDADILGGINAGIDTCWLNPHKKPTTENIAPHFEVASLQELQELLHDK